MTDPDEHDDIGPDLFVDDPPRRPATAWLVAALAPWLLVAVLVLGPGRQPDAQLPVLAPGAVPALAATDAPDHPAVDADEPPAPTTPPVPVESGSGGDDRGDAIRVAVADPALLGVVGAAEIALRRHLRAGGAWVLGTAVEAIDLPAPGAAAVRVAVDVLDPQGTAATTQRWGVGVTLDGGATVHDGDWWRLPDVVTSTDRAPQGTPVDDPDLLVETAAALARAGIAAVEVTDLVRAGGWVLRAGYRDAHGAGAAWLVDDRDGLRVAAAEGAP